MSEERLELFGAALRTLTRFLDQPVEDDRDLAGIIQAFEFSFELCWRCMQDRADARDFLEKGPKASMRSAMHMGIIRPEEEETWLALSRDRNLATHTYRPTLAEGLVERIRAQYVEALQAALDRMRSMG